MQLRQIFNTGYLLTEAAWYFAESLADPADSPSLRALTRWAARFRCYAGATLLEATREGHIYNSFVLAAPDGSVVRRPAAAVLDGGGGSVALVRKHRASSLEGFVFRSACAAGRGGEPEAHVIEVDATLLLAKRAERSVSTGASSSAGQPGSVMLRLGVAICYENFCLEPMATLQVRLAEACQQMISLLAMPGEQLSWNHLLCMSGFGEVTS